MGASPFTDVSLFVFVRMGGHDDVGTTLGIVVGVALAIFTKLIICHRVYVNMRLTGTEQSAAAAVKHRS